MNKTGYAYHTIAEIITELDSLEKDSKEIIHHRKKLLREEDCYLKSVFLDTPKLALRFIDLYKKNKWKIQKEKIDEYLLKNLDQINEEAWEMSRHLGEEKHSYLDYNLFKPWEGYYARFRDYCNYLSIVGQISGEFRERYFDGKHPLDKQPNEPNIVYKGLKKILNIGIKNIPVIKDVLSK